MTSEKKDIYKKVFFRRIIDPERRKDTFMFVDATTLVRKIHETPTKIVLTITGGGFQAIGDLGRMGGLSNTLLAAHQPYHPEAQKTLLKFKPEKSCCIETARELAMFSYQEALKIAPDEPQLAGIGCTSALALSEGVVEREGREHKIFTAMQFDNETITWSLHLKQSRNRILEEGINRRVILDAIGFTCGISPYTGNGYNLLLPLTTNEKMDIDHCSNNQLEAEFNFVKGHIKDILNNNIPYTIAVPDKKCIYSDNVNDEPGMAFLSGNFNPLHEAHEKMREIGSKILGQEVFYEMPIFNADKPPLNYFTIRDRLRNFKHQKYPVFISKAGTFAEKAKIYPKSKFLVGIDTARRICDPKFYHNSKGMMLEAFEDLKNNECKFVVFGRVSNDVFEHIDDSYPKEFQQLCIQVDEKDFRNDISSTKIRNENGNS